MNHPSAPAPLPLVLDLDGTVLRTDLLLEGLVLAVRRRPWLILLLPFWLLLGRAAMKRKVAQSAQLRVDLLPLNDALVRYAAQASAEGRPVYIASAADESLARRVADRLGFVRDVLASDGRRNLKAGAKALALAERFPEGFAYAGDTRADLPVWRAAAQGVFAGRSRAVERAAAGCVDMAPSLAQPRPGLRVWRRALRLHQWSKNALVFAPLLLAGFALQPQAWINVVLAFAAIGLVSSATYLINDLLDLEDDRAHWSKKDRPLASGALPIHYALAAAPLGVAAGLALGWLAGGPAGVGCLFIYLVVTGAYSLGLKRYPIIDVLIIASLFTVRLLLGAMVVGAPLKPWLFVFSMFLFTALSMAKRAAEIGRIGAAGGERLGGRGYVAVDQPVITAFGVAAGVAAVLVLVLYIKDEAFDQTFYGVPALLWCAPAVLTLWLGRIWLICGRGELDDDPVAFAIKDKVSLGLGAALAILLGAAIFL